jgi:hypothetical protein
MPLGGGGGGGTGGATAAAAGSGGGGEAGKGKSDKGDKKKNTSGSGSNGGMGGLLEALAMANTNRVLGTMPQNKSSHLQEPLSPATPKTMKQKQKRASEVIRAKKV